MLLNFFQEMGYEALLEYKKLSYQNNLQKLKNIKFKIYAKNQEQPKLATRMHLSKPAKFYKYLAAKCAKMFKVKKSYVEF